MLYIIVARCPAELCTWWSDVSRLACNRFTAAVADALNASSEAASTALTAVQHLRALLGPFVGLHTTKAFRDIRARTKSALPDFSAKRGPTPPRCLDMSSPYRAGCVHVGQPSLHQAVLHGYICLGLRHRRRWIIRAIVRVDDFCNEIYFGRVKIPCMFQTGKLQPWKMGRY